MGSEKELLVLWGEGKNDLQAQSWILASWLWIHKWHSALGVWWYYQVEEKKAQSKTRYWTLPWMSLSLADIWVSLWLSERLPHALESKLTAHLKGSKLPLLPKQRIKKNSECGTLQFPISFFFPTWVFLSLNQCFEKCSKKKK